MLQKLRIIAVILTTITLSACAKKISADYWSNLSTGVGSKYQK